MWAPAPPMRQILIVLAAACALVAGASAQEVLNVLRVQSPPSSPFVARGTCAVFGGVHPDAVRMSYQGQTLPTQVEVVARARDFWVIEVLGYCGGASGEVAEFQILEGGPPSGVAGLLSLYDPRTVQVLTAPGLELELALRDGQKRRAALFSPDRSSFHRLGTCKLTVKRWVQDPSIGLLQWWMTITAGSPRVELLLNWSNGSLPANPDVIFSSLRLHMPPGWSLRETLPDPSVDPGQGWVVVPGTGPYAVPTRWERHWRLEMVPTSRMDAPSEGEGWGVCDWSEGGFLPTGAPVPTITTSNLEGRSQAALSSLEKLEATKPGNDPESALWPAQGVKYGGMTGGLGIEEFDGLQLAATGLPLGRRLYQVEMLRTGARQWGAIYKDGRPIDVEEFAQGDRAAWSMADGFFLSRKDSPWGFTKIPQPNPDGTRVPALAGYRRGESPQDYGGWGRIDHQHLIRALKAPMALAWLDNDPLARQAIRNEANLARITMWEGTGQPYKQIRMPGTPGRGTSWGRAEAWMGYAVAGAHAMAGDRDRQEFQGWAMKYVDHLRQAQLPTGLFSSYGSGKISETPPYGEWKQEQNRSQVYYRAGRSNEQIYLSLALLSLHKCVGAESDDILAKAADGLWSYAWWPGTTGLRERYPSGRADGAPFSNRSEWPDDLTSKMGKSSWHYSDSYHAGVVPWIAFEAGSTTSGASLLAWTQAGNFEEARALMESWGVRAGQPQGKGVIENWGPTLALLQQSED